LPFPNDYFGSAISNSVLEHIPDVQPVLNDLARVIRPGGRLVITLPGDRFTTQLGGAQLLDKMGLSRLAEKYRLAFNRLARHAHTDPPQRWQQRLTRSGLVVESWQPYFSEQALHALEVGHIFGIPSLLLHALTRRWIIAPWRSSLYLTERWLRPLFEESPNSEGTMLLFVARKIGGSGDASAVIQDGSSSESAP
jgi:SAM-dependent methyltransferase